jgi:hypothetical protein
VQNDKKALHAGCCAKQYKGNKGKPKDTHNVLPIEMHTAISGAVQSTAYISHTSAQTCVLEKNGAMHC